MPKDTTPVKTVAKRTTAKPKQTPLKRAAAPRSPRLKYIGRNRETSVSGITFELNKAVPVSDAALFAKLSLNPYFAVVK
ncbi:MAG: hypothetical protein ABJN69_13010 [Hellea sp.]